MTIRLRLYLLSLLSLVSIVLIIGLSFFQMDTLREALAYASSGAGAKALRHQAQADMMHDALRGDVLSVLLWADNKGDDAEYQEIVKSLDEHVKSLTDSVAANKELKHNAEVRAALDEAQKKLASYEKASKSVVTLAQTDIAAAKAEMKNFYAEFAALEKEMEAVSDKIESEGADQIKDVFNQSETGKKMIVLVAGAVAVLFIIIALVLTRSIIRPIDAARTLAERIGHGDLDDEGTVISSVSKGKNEISALVRSLTKMRTTLADMIRSQTTVTTAHSAGHIGERIAVDGLSGAYKDLGEGLNALIDVHTNVQQTMMTTLSAYAVGDFTNAPPDLPGELATITDALSQTRESLLCISTEVFGLVDAAVQGEFSSRGNASKFENSFFDIVNGFNKLMETNERVFSAIKEISVALANGDLSKRITTEFPGVFGVTTQALNNTVLTLSELINEVKQSVSKAAEGDFTYQIDANGKLGVGRDLSLLLNAQNKTTQDLLLDMLDKCEALACGDLTQSMATSYPGTLGQVSVAFNQTVENLRQLVTAISESATRISTSSNQIAAGNSDLSNRTEQQAVAIQETAASMEELSSTIQQNADNSSSVNALATQAERAAKLGGEEVRNVSDNMEDIQSSANKMSDIVTVIDAIAFQTNILALNAAVEAARAGESGRGFAVVASEVRNLAQRSSTAAKEIKTLISDSVEKINAGHQRVNATSDSIKGIVDSITHVTKLVSEISQASKEQAAGAQGVNAAVVQMDDMTQRNVSMVAQVATAAEELSNEARALVEHTSSFKVS